MLEGIGITESIQSLNAQREEQRRSADELRQKRADRYIQRAVNVNAGALNDIPAPEVNPNLSAALQTDRNLSIAFNKLVDQKSFFGDMFKDMPQEQLDKINASIDSGDSIFALLEQPTLEEQAELLSVLRNYSKYERDILSSVENEEHRELLSTFIADSIDYQKKIREITTNPEMNMIATGAYNIANPENPLNSFSEEPFLEQLAFIQEKKNLLNDGIIVADTTENSAKIAQYASDFESMADQYFGNAEFVNKAAKGTFTSSILTPAIIGDVATGSTARKLLTFFGVDPTPKDIEQIRLDLNAVSPELMNSLDVDKQVALSAALRMWQTTRGSTFEPYYEYVVDKIISNSDAEDIDFYSILKYQRTIEASLGEKLSLGAYTLAEFASLLWVSNKVAVAGGVVGKLAGGKLLSPTAMNAINNASFMNRIMQTGSMYGTYGAISGFFGEDDYEVLDIASDFMGGVLFQSGISGAAAGAKALLTPQVKQSISEIYGSSCELISKAYQSVKPNAAAQRAVQLNAERLLAASPKDIQAAGGSRRFLSKLILQDETLTDKVKKTTIDAINESGLKFNRFGDKTIVTYFDQSKGMFSAYVGVGNKYFNLGNYQTMKDALLASKQALTETSSIVGLRGEVYINGGSPLVSKFDKIKSELKAVKNQALELQTNPETSLSNKQLISVVDDVALRLNKTGHFKNAQALKNMPISEFGMNDNVYSALNKSIDLLDDFYAGSKFNGLMNDFKKVYESTKTSTIRKGSDVAKRMPLSDVQIVDTNKQIGLFIEGIKGNTVSYKGAKLPNSLRTLGEKFSQSYNDPSMKDDIKNLYENFAYKIERMLVKGTIDTDDAETLWQMAKFVKHQSVNRDKLFVLGKLVTIDDFTDDVISEIKTPRLFQKGLDLTSAPSAKNQGRFKPNSVYSRLYEETGIDMLTGRGAWQQFSVETHRKAAEKFGVNPKTVSNVLDQQVVTIPKNIKVNGNNFIGEGTTEISANKALNIYAMASDGRAKKAFVQANKFFDKDGKSMIFSIGVVDDAIIAERKALSIAYKAATKSANQASIEASKAALDAHVAKFGDIGIDVYNKHKSLTSKLQGLRNKAFKLDPASKEGQKLAKQIREVEHSLSLNPVETGSYADYVKKIIEPQLTPEMKAALEGWRNTNSALSGAVNSVTVDIWGAPIANDPFYYPYLREKTSAGAKIIQSKSPLHATSVKPTTGGTSPFVIDNFTDTIMKHIRETVDYVSTGRNLYAMESFIQNPKTRSALTKLGQGHLVDDLLDELALMGNAAQMDKFSQAVVGTIGPVQGSMLALNLSAIFNQTTSLGAATAGGIPMRYLFKPNPIELKKSMDILKKDPYFYYRFRAGGNHPVSSWLRKTTSYDKYMNEFSLMHIDGSTGMSITDFATVSQIFTGARYYVGKKLGLATDNPHVIEQSLHLTKQAVFRTQPTWEAFTRATYQSQTKFLSTLIQPFRTAQDAMLNGVIWNYNTYGLANPNTINALAGFAVSQAAYVGTRTGSLIMMNVGRNALKEKFTGSIGDKEDIPSLKLIEDNVKDTLFGIVPFGNIVAEQIVMPIYKALNGESSANGGVLDGSMLDALKDRLVGDPLNAVADYLNILKMKNKWESVDSIIQTDSGKYKIYDSKGKEFVFEIKGKEVNEFTLDQIVMITSNDEKFSDTAIQEFTDKEKYALARVVLQTVSAAAMILGYPGTSYATREAAKIYDIPDENLVIGKDILFLMGDDYKKKWRYAHNFTSRDMLELQKELDKETETKSMSEGIKNNTVFIAPNESFPSEISAKKVVNGLLKEQLSAYNNLKRDIVNQITTLEVVASKLSDDVERAEILDQIDNQRLLYIGVVEAQGKTASEFMRWRDGKPSAIEVFKDGNVWDAKIAEEFSLEMGGITQAYIE